MNIIVIGLGETGLSCVRYLCEQGHQITVMDTRQAPPQLNVLRAEHPEITVILGDLPRDVLLQADRLVVSPGLSLQTPAIAEARAHGIECVGDIELFAQACYVPVIAITGSNGKTTLTSLMGHMLSEVGYTVEVCGNIGEPVLNTLKNKPSDFYVMELSSFQLETTYSLRAKVAVVLNVSPDHMDRYETLQAYSDAKFRVYAECETAVLNADEPEIWRDFPLDKPHYTFSVAPDSTVDFHLASNNGEKFIFYKEEPWISLKELPWQGQHNYQNTLAALAIGHALGLDKKQMFSSIKSFVGLPHRCQKIASFLGVDWYNDSKATNVGAVIAALNSLGPLYSDIILIAGGDAKNADLSSLKPPVCQFVSQVILLGKDADRLEALLSEVVQCRRVRTLDEAVALAYDLAKPHSAVLLSPACASLDMFENYKQRGELFVKAVKRIEHADE